MLKTQITGAKYLSPQTNQMTNLNIAIPADSKDTKFGTSDILLAKDVVAYLNALDSDISNELATQTDKINKINGSIKQLIDHNLIKIVTELPTTDIDKNCIYLVPNKDGEGNNVFIEYIYVESKNTFEEVGRIQTKVDLSDYYTKEEVDDQMTAVKNKFPLSVNSFTVTPGIIPVGKDTTMVTYKWSYNNEDVHAVVKQTVNDHSILANIRTMEIPIDITTAHNIRTTLKANDSITRTIMVYVVNYSYTGLVSASTTTVTSPKGLVPIALYNKNYICNYTQVNEKIVYLYPTSYGRLTSIVDQNGFEGISGFERQIVTINNVQYYLYISKIPANSSVTLTFK
jgi:hypothetical protein